MALFEMEQLQHVLHHSCAYRPAFGDSMILCRLLARTFQHHDDKRNGKSTRLLAPHGSERTRCGRSTLR